MASEYKPLEFATMGPRVKAKLQLVINGAENRDPWAAAPLPRRIANRSS